MAGGFFSDATSITLSYLTLVVVILIVVVALALGRALVAWWDCTTSPDIQCYDDWYCPGSAQWPQGSTGLASSLFGPESPAAGSCDLGSTSYQCYTAAASCPATEFVPQGCGCSFAGGASTCLSSLCGIASPGWAPGAASGCPAVAGAS